MPKKILMVGHFEGPWLRQLSGLGDVLHAPSAEEAVSVLRRQEFAVVLVRGQPGRLEEMRELAPDLLEIKDDEREQSLFLQSVLDNLPHMVFVKDAKELRIVRLNKAGEQLVGFSHEDMVGKTDFDFFSEEEAAFFHRMDREVLEQGILRDIPEETLNTRHHGIRILHTKKIPICNEEGDPLYLLGISEDITELKEMKALAASRLEAAREAERRHIARELHDELGQLLTALKLDLGRLQSQLQPELRRQTDPMSDLLDHTIKTVRRLATELRPQILDDLGLKAGLDWLIKQSCERKGISHDLRWGLADSEVNDDARSALFRICQEALNNVVRHSQASHVLIELRRERHRLLLQVSDDGIGLGAGGRQRSGLGLLGIQERIGLLGGTFQIESPRQGGARLTVSAPLDRCLRPLEGQMETRSPTT
jgi:PAS domain S-box-containing protein